MKGHTGHSEAAAGVAGLMEAAMLAYHACTAPALHLRTLNPHVAGLVANSQGASIARGGPYAVPRGEYVGI